MDRGTKVVRVCLGLALVLAAVAAIAPVGAARAQDNGLASITIYNSVCPPDYVGADYYADCYGIAGSGHVFDLVGLGYAGGSATTGASGIAWFEGITVDGSYVLTVTYPVDVADYAVICSAGGVPFPLTYVAGGVQLDLTTSDDLRCDWFSVPVGPNTNGLASVTIYTAVCPEGYTDATYFADCFGSPGAGVTYALAGPGGAAEATSGPAGIAFFEGIATAGSYTLSQFFPADVAHQLVLCSEGEAEFPVTNVAGGVQLELATSDDLRCDWYTVPAGEAAADPDAPAPTDTPIPTETPPADSPPPTDTPEPTATPAATETPATDSPTATPPSVGPDGPIAGGTVLGPGTYRVTGTREGLVGRTTASGHVIVANDRFVSLPACTSSSCSWLEPGVAHDRWGLRTECGETCYVRVTNPVTGSCAVAPVLDVGPWFTLDDWWNPTADRFLNNLPTTVNILAQGYTGNDAARDGLDVGYGVGPSGIGISNKGVEVGNRSAIDIGDGTWADLGFAYDDLMRSDGVVVTMLWQSGEDPAAAAAACGRSLPTTTAADLDGATGA